MPLEDDAPRGEGIARWGLDHLQARSANGPGRLKVCNLGLHRRRNAINFRLCLVNFALDVETGGHQF
jgi:hypothetical protein